MARLAYRRLIVLIVLLCQVATAANLPMVHVPVIENPGSGHTHCAERAQPSAYGGLQHASPSRTDHTQHPGSCGCGCQCACAQLPALARAVDVFSVTTHLPVTVPCRAVDVSQVAAVLFRPPI